MQTAMRRWRQWLETPWKDKELAAEVTVRVQRPRALQAQEKNLGHRQAYQTQIFALFRGCPKAAEADGKQPDF